MRASATRRADVRVAAAGAAVVGVAFGMGRFAFGLTLPDLRADPTLSPTGLDDPTLGLIAAATFAGYVAGILAAPLLARHRGARAPTTVGGLCGTLGGAVVVPAGSPAVLAVGAVLVGSAAGWVWAPYSDLVAGVAVPARRPGLLALVSTGTSAGLVAVALVAALGPGWRAVWASVALASAAAAAWNLRATPSPPPVGRDPAGALPRRRLAVPAAYAVGYSVATTLFFTYAAESVRRGGLPPAAGPALYAVIGVVGLTGLLAGRWSRRWGPSRVAAACLGSIAVALVVLATGGSSWAAALGAATLFAPGYMAGAAVLAVWTAHLVPRRATAAMTAVVAVGAVAAVLAPALAGALLPLVGLPAVLLATAVLTAAGGVALARPASP